MEEINNSLSRIFSENEKNNIHIFEKDTFITTKKYFEQILDEVKDRKKYYNQRYFILEGNNKNNYSSEELQRRLDEMEKDGLNTDYVTMFDDKIKFLIINGDNVNNKKQSEIVKNILKEETLYEIQIFFYYNFSNRNNTANQQNGKKRRLFYNKAGIHF